MKATINGVTYEGTYEEIAAIVDRMTPKVEANPNVQPLRHTGGWWGIHQPHITSGQTSAVTNYKCPNEGQPCNCTGACTRPQGMGVLSKNVEIIDNYYKSYQNS